MAGHVIEHQQHAGHDQDEEQVKRDQPQPERVVRNFSEVPVDLGRLHVQQEAGDHRLRPLQVALRQADAEDRAADARALERISRAVWAEACSHHQVFVGLDPLVFVHQQPAVPAQRQLENHASGAGRRAALTPPWSLNTLPWQGQW